MRLRSSFWISLLALVLTGCAYQLGPVNGERAGAKGVEVVPFSNKTLEPHLTDAITTAVRRRLQEDGTYRLATHDDGDIVLTGVIIKYSRTELTLDPNDVAAYRDYQITITAEVTAKNQNGDVIFSQPVKGYTQVRVGSDLTSAERQALPLVSQDLAKHAVSLLAEGKWW